MVASGRRRASNSLRRFVSRSGVSLRLMGGRKPPPGPAAFSEPKLDVLSTEARRWRGPPGVCPRFLFIFFAVPCNVTLPQNRLRPLLPIAVGTAAPDG